MERSSFVFYKSFYEALQGLDAEQFKSCMIALLEYALNGEEVADDNISKMFLQMAKPILDKNNQRYENGKRGGRPKNQTETNGIPSVKQNETKQKPNRNQTETKQKPNGEKSKPYVYVYEDVYEDEDKKIINANAKIVIDFLNKETGKAFRYSETSLRHIRARLNDGYTVEDCKKVIRTKVAEWKNTQMEKYLNPETLFSGKFEKYLNQEEHVTSSPIPKYMEEKQVITKANDDDINNIKELMKGMKQ